MKVASKVATGSGVTIALLVAVLTYDLVRVQELNEVNRNLAEVGLLTTTISLDQGSVLDQVDEFTRKQFVTADPAYTAGLSALHVEFWQSLERLRTLDQSETIRAQVEALNREWRAYLNDFSYDPQATETGSGGAEEHQRRLLERIEALRERVEKIGQMAQTEMTEQAVIAAETNLRAHRLYWLVAGLVVVVSLLILWLTVRSIDGPLSRLMAGTRAVSQGEFSYRLDSSGQDEFSALAGSFNDMVERLGDAERVKKDFLSHVSHELKSPLASMEETTELMLDEIPGPLTSRQRRFLNLNLESGRRLSAMIARLLDLSRLESGVMEYEFRAHDLSAIIRNVVEEFEARALESKVEIVYRAPNEPLIVECDRDRLYQVLQNILDNAMKVSSSGDTIGIEVEPSPVRPDSARVEISDRGPGIEDSLKSAIFEKFLQPESGRSRGRGVGLGLAICREIMEAHQGEVWVRDNPGGGSIFAIRVPLSAQEIPIRDGEQGRPVQRVEA